LAEKLQAEIASLRETAATAHDKFEKERAQRLAFEERVEIWVQNEDKLQKEVNKWKGRAALKYSFAAAAAGATGLAGYAIAGLVADTDAPMATYFMTMIGVPASIRAVAGLMIGLLEHYPIKGMLRGGIAGGFMGLVMATIGSIPIAVNFDKDVRQTTQTLLDEKCSNAPCMMTKNKDGEMVVQAMSEAYAGHEVILDFTNPENLQMLARKPFGLKETVTGDNQQDNPQDNEITPKPRASAPKPVR